MVSTGLTKGCTDIGRFWQGFFLSGEVAFFMEYKITVSNRHGKERLRF
jgi:hypothetical protein